MEVWSFSVYFLPLSILSFKLLTASYSSFFIFLLSSSFSFTSLSFDLNRSRILLFSSSSCFILSAISFSLVGMSLSVLGGLLRSSFRGEGGKSFVGTKLLLSRTAASGNQYLILLDFGFPQWSRYLLFVQRHC